MHTHTHAFMVQTMNTCARGFCERLLEAGASEDGVVDVPSLYSHYTFDVVLRCAFRFHCSAPHPLDCGKAYPHAHTCTLTHAQPPAPPHACVYCCSLESGSDSSPGVDEFIRNNMAITKVVAKVQSMHMPVADHTHTHTFSRCDRNVCGCGCLCTRCRSSSGVGRSWRA